MIEIDEMKMKEKERRIRNAKLKDIAYNDEIRLLREREAYHKKMNDINSVTLNNFMKVMDKIQTHLEKESKILRIAELRNEEMRATIEKIMKHKKGDVL